ncbi:hypothetical protein GCM10010140_56580 [Streptosporangium pseudovulgare]|uniref:Uncharacterized protein n=1 Tax=Streptosporangium pseudovulgare TaxID=35765 RepID=A0ABQ2RB27_9ACTN|nr:hypothetical protein GCM10010140_56580 [Streptosporangium pseudovulgare]
MSPRAVRLFSRVRVRQAGRRAASGGEERETVSVRDDSEVVLAEMVTFNSELIVADSEAEKPKYVKPKPSPRVRRRTRSRSGQAALPVPR